MGVSSQHDEQGLLLVEFSPEGRRPPLLTPAVFEFIDSLLAEAERDPPLGLIFAGKRGDDFQGGVDLTAMSEIGSCQEAFDASRRGQLLFQRIADLPCPTVASIEGRCMGGGLEMSLACNARIAADSEATLLMLPEIHLGIICGFGGTQRLPRTIGQKRALQMILAAQPVPARKAFEWGLVDRLVSPDTLYDEAVQLVSDLVDGKTARTGARVRRKMVDRILDGTGTGRKIVRNRSNRLVEKKTGGHFPAPARAIEAVGKSADGLDLPAGLLLEAELLGELVAGDVHPHLLRLVRARQFLRRPRGTDPTTGNRADFAEGLVIPVQIIPVLKKDFSSPPSIPTISLEENAGIVRRLPGIRRPGVVEAVWNRASGDSRPGADEPETFQDVACRIASAAGYSVVHCRSADRSPGLNLIGAYLLEGDRLVAEGWSARQVDTILKGWGMECGPFALTEQVGTEWLKRIDLSPSRHSIDLSAVSNRKIDFGSEMKDRLIEEVNAALVLEMMKMWEIVLDPVEEGWLVLDIFALGGPSYCGGIMGAARRMGRDQTADRLRSLEDRWGEHYSPAILLKSGLI